MDGSLLLLVFVTALSAFGLAALEVAARRSSGGTIGGKPQATNAKRPVE
jgi:uncharacterized membrane protein